MYKPYGIIPPLITPFDAQGAINYDVFAKQIDYQAKRDAYKNQTSKTIRKGIGLSICKTIISAHKGTITAENHGCGAKFSFTLPM